MILPILIILTSSTAVFIAVLVLAYLGEGPKFQERYRSFEGDSHDFSSAGVETADQTTFLERAMFPLFDNLSRWFTSLNQKTMIDSAQRRLQEAGIANSMPPHRFIGLNLFCGFALSAFFFLLAWLGENPNPFLRYFLPLAVFLPGKNLPMFLLAKRATKRKDRIRKELPYVMDLLTISVEAGLGFDAALVEVSHRTSGPLADEIAQTLMEIRLGRSRVDALKDLPERTGVQELRNVVSAIIHVSKSGGSLAKVLRVQAASVRNKRKQHAEEMAMKAPVKIIFPLVLFIFPAIFVVVLGPIGMEVMKLFNQ